jgi:hypothetical protein
MMNPNSRTEFFFLFQTFHTPSFDDDFDITSLNLPPVSNLQTPIQTTFHQQSYSDFVISNYNVYPQQQPNPVSSVNPLNTATLTPTFPPLNFDIPDISVTNNLDGCVSSLTSMAMMTSSIDNQNSPYPSASMAIAAPTMTNNAEISIIKMEDNFTDPKQEISPSHSTNSVSPPRESSEDSSDDCLPLAQVKSCYYQSRVMRFIYLYVV